MILVLARAAGWVFTKLGQPAVVGEILAGILLGPTLLGTSLSEDLFPLDSRPFLVVLANLGLVLFMFVVGLELDLSLVKGRERVAGSVSVCVDPAAVQPGHRTGHPARRRGTSRRARDFWPFALFIGAAMSITAFPVLARILTDRGMHRTETGGLALACAATDDILAWTLLAVVIGIAGGEMAGDNQLGRLPRHAVRAADDLRGAAAAQPVDRRLREGGRAHPAADVHGAARAAAVRRRPPSSSTSTSSSAPSCSARSSRTRAPRPCATRSWCASSRSRCCCCCRCSSSSPVSRSTSRASAEHIVQLARDPRRGDRREVRRCLRRRPLRRSAALAGQQPRDPDEHPRPDRADHPQRRAREGSARATSCSRMMVIMALVTTVMTGPLLGLAYPQRRVVRDIAEAERAALGGRRDGSRARRGRERALTARRLVDVAVGMLARQPGRPRWSWRTSSRSAPASSRWAAGCPASSPRWPRRWSDSRCWCDAARSRESRSG